MTESNRDEPLAEKQPELEEISRDPFLQTSQTYICPNCQGPLRVSPNPYRSAWDYKKKMMIYHHSLDCPKCCRMWRQKDTKTT